VKGDVAATSERIIARAAPAQNTMTPFRPLSTKAMVPEEPPWGVPVEAA
jgi:hypothetical protein